MRKHSLGTRRWGPLSLWFRSPRLLKSLGGMPPGVDEIYPETQKALDVVGLGPFFIFKICADYVVVVT